MDRSMFEPQVAALASAYRVITYDHRARTSRWDEVYDLQDLAADCRELLDSLSIERCVLGGMSMGGFMALEFALAHPERLDGLILIDVMAQAYSAEEQEGFGHEFGKLDMDGPLPREWAEWAAPYCFGQTTQERNPGLVRAWVDRWCTMPARAVFHEGFSWLHKADLSDRISSITVPTLIIHGVEDMPIAIERARPMATGMPNARFVEVPRAGHTSNLENPEVVNEAILRFLRDVYRG
jgi:pimeloyl-ACP methyl ester carboxylesterase